MKKRSVMGAIAGALIATSTLAATQQMDPGMPGMVTAIKRVQP